MVRKYVKVLDVMRAKGGRVAVNDPDMLAVMGNLTEKHVASLMWRIRTHAGLEVRGIRNGRKVVAYELVAMASDPVVDATVDTTDDIIDTTTDTDTTVYEASPAA